MNCDDVKWIFDGIGTAAVTRVVSFIAGCWTGHHFTKKKKVKQNQIAKESAIQDQSVDNSEMLNKEGTGDVQISVKQVQKAGKGSSQIQRG